MRARALTWRERLALCLIALVAVPVTVLVFAGLFLFAVGLGAVALAGWLAATLLWPRGARTRDRGAALITAEYVRLSEERERSEETRP